MTKKKETKKPKRSFGQMAKAWGLRIFYTAFFVIIFYIVVMAGAIFTPNFITTMLPSIMEYTSKGLTASGVEEITSSMIIVISMLSGLFIVAWVFTISLFIIKKVYHSYTNNIKETLSENDRLKFEKKEGTD